MNLVEIIKASLGWGILMVVVILGIYIVKGNVTEQNSFQLADAIEILALLAGAYAATVLGSSKNGTPK